MPAINPQRLLDDLHALRGFGANGNGVVRTALSRYLVQDLNSPFRHFLVLGYRTT